MQTAQSELRRRMGESSVAHVADAAPDNALCEIQAGAAGKAAKGSRIPTKRRGSIMPQRRLSYAAADMQPVVAAHPEGMQSNMSPPAPLQPPQLPAPAPCSDEPGLDISSSPFVPEAAGASIGCGGSCAGISIGRSSAPSLKMLSPTSPPKSAHRPALQSSTGSEVDSLPTPASPPKSIHRGRRPPTDSMSSDPIDTPSLAASPPRSVGRGRLTSARSAVHVERSPWSESPLAMRSPPKSVRAQRGAVFLSDDEDDAPAEIASTPTKPPAPAITPTRSLRNTPARQARAAQLTRSPGCAKLLTTDVSQPEAQAVAPRKLGSRAQSARTRSQARPTTSDAPPARDELSNESQRSGSGAAKGIDLSKFPKTFQSGVCTDTPRLTSPLPF
jgi:hypothetical protein